MPDIYKFFSLEKPYQTGQLQIGFEQVSILRKYLFMSAGGMMAFIAARRASARGQRPYPILTTKSVSKLFFKRKEVFIHLQFFRLKRHIIGANIVHEATPKKSKFSSFDFL